MREILFRGKRKDNGKWVYGSLLKQAGEYISKDEVAPIECWICGMRGEQDLIVSETIGQYTGLKDLHGTRIFEGDILKISFGKGFFKAVVKFGYYNQTDKILKSHLGFYFDFVDSESYRKDVGSWTWTGKTFSKIEIIGNIHDNPELLKGGAENE